MQTDHNTILTVLSGLTVDDMPDAPASLKRFMEARDKGADPGELERLAQRVRRQGKKLVTRYTFPATTQIVAPAKKDKEVGTYPVIVTHYTWAWSAWDADKETPITLEFGDVERKEPDAPALISSLWG